jgi:hypothetical protein
MVSEWVVLRQHSFEACVLPSEKNIFEYVMCERRIWNNNDPVVLLLKRECLGTLEMAQGEVGGEVTN